MKNAFSIGMWGLLFTSLVGSSATSPLYVNDSPVDCFDTPPQVDASVFLNRSIFCVNTLSFPPLPYETLNTLFFTNAASGRMSGDPGFRFNYARGNVRRKMDSWVNRGSIATDNTTFLITGLLPFSLSGAEGNWLLVSATNIISTGPLSVGSQGLIRLEGQDVDLARGRLRSGQSLTNNGFFFGSSVLSSNYINDFGITDIYWGTGTNNALDDMGALMRLDGGGFGNNLFAQLPFPQSPIHQVVENFGSGFRFTNTVSVPTFFQSTYGARVLRTQTGPTNAVVQVVFYPTNNFDTNLTTSVEFLPGLGTRNGAWAVVGFHALDFDIVNQQQFTNSVYLVDASAFRTNTFLARELNAGTRRPGHFEVTRNQPFPSFGTVPTNVIYSPDLIYNPNYLSNEVEVLYSAYQAQISSVNTPGFTLPNNPLADPTNFPGRIEIVGDTLNLTETKIRADSTIVIRAQNLVSNQFAAVDAPFMTFNLGSSQPTLVISNIAPATVGRVSGTISAWAATWQNFETNQLGTNTAITAIDFHVLIVEPNIQGRQPVVVNEFKAQAQNISLVDPLTVGSQFRLDATSIDVGSALTLPFRTTWANSNVLNVVNLTNRGSINLTASGFFGSDRDTPYENFVNSGVIAGTSLFVDTVNFDNSGHLIAGAGLLSIEAETAKMEGLPTLIVTNTFTNFFPGFTSVVAVLQTNSFGPLLAADSDIIFTASELTLSNSVIHAGLTAPGSLVLDVSDRLWGPDGSGTNEWVVRGGFNVVTKPAESDLLGVTITSIADSFAETLHRWPADDLGAVNEGYVNNMAVRKLVLDGQTQSSVHRFLGNGSDRAIYVDYLQLENFSTNFFPNFPQFPENRLVVDPGFMIYFADSNVSSDKLDGAAGGRIRWVRTYTGPLSSTNLTYPDDQVYTFNRALVTSRDLDSDGDGIPNFFDETPIFVEGNINLTVTPMEASGAGAGVGTSIGAGLVLSWNALAYAVNTLQYTDELSPDATWQVLTQFVGNSFTTRVQVTDSMTEGVGQRFYKVMIEPPAH